MKRLAWLWVVGALMLAGIGMLAYRMQTPNVAATPATGPAVATKAEAELPAWPTSAANFGASREALRAHARRGNAEAAWRIAQGLLGCLSLDAHDAAAGHDDASIARQRVECAGVEPDVRETRRWLKEAARLGSLEARIRYAADPLLIATAANAELDEWRDWRDDAPKYVDDAVASGEVEAVLLRANASTVVPCWLRVAPTVEPDACGRSVLLREVSVQDDTIAYAHFRLAQALGAAAESGSVGIMLEQLASSLTPAQRAEAEALAQQLLRPVRR